MAAGFTAAHAAGAKVLLADVSEFDPDINDAKYLAWSQAIVIRAAYGAHHDDRAWFGGARRDLLLQGGAKFLGIYQYVTAAEDVTVQAKALLRIIGGKLNEGEVPLADIEEGSGSQAGRWATWRKVIQDGTGFDPWDYAGLNFARDHGLEPVSWVAAYQSSEPPVHHSLWQFTDAFAVPGVGVADCSVWHGTIAQLAALAYGGGVIQPIPNPPPVPAAPPFPYPAADYLGLQSADPHCHSGYHAGDRPHVSAWQGQMAHRGWTITADGSYGLQSDGVCRAFQAEKNLTADGKVGPATWAASWDAPVT
jgi:peptidoglycan hydrolase-like protein with peptidoglycan-binding domain